MFLRMCIFNQFKVTHLLGPDCAAGERWHPPKRAAIRRGMLTTAALAVVEDPELPPKIDLGGTSDNVKAGEAKSARNKLQGECSGK